MTKLCPRGKAAAKRKFAVYPSAYANAYASKICAGKIKDPSGVKRKDFKGPKPAGKAMGGKIKKDKGAFEKESRRQKQKQRKGIKRIGEGLRKLNPMMPRPRKELQKLQRPMGGLRPRKMGGGMMQMPRAMYGKGGGVCKRGMNRQAIGKNS